MEATAIQEDQNILKQLRDMMEASEAANPREAAAEIVAKLPTKVCRLALQATLYEWVRNRSGMSNMIRGQSETEAPTGRERRMKAVDDYNRKWLKARVSIGPNEYRFVKDCTAQDMRYAAELRRKQMENLENWVKRFEAIATIIEDAEVNTVGELSKDKLDAIEDLWGKHDLGDE